MASLLVVLLLAVASISDSTRGNANADQTRSDTLNGASAGLSGIVADLRQACYLIAPDTAQITAGTFCRVPLTTLSASTATGTRTVTPVGPTVNGSESTACSSTATPPTTSNNCLEFLMRGRTVVNRDATGAVSGTTRTLWRVRYNCAIADPRDPLRTNTQCERFATRCTTDVAGATTCLAPCSSSATSCTASSASTDARTAGSVSNSAATDPAVTPRPIFLYCARADILSCSATFSGAAAAIRVDLAIARRGALRTGLRNSVELKDAAELRNSVTDGSTRDDAPSE